MPLQAIHELLWAAVLTLTASGRMTRKEATEIALVRFTWTREKAQAKLDELQNRLIKRN